MDAVSPRHPQRVAGAPRGRDRRRIDGTKRCVPTGLRSLPLSSPELLSSGRAEAPIAARIEGSGAALSRRVSRSVLRSLCWLRGQNARQVQALGATKRVYCVFSRQRCSLCAQFSGRVPLYDRREWEGSSSFANIYRKLLVKCADGC